MAGNVNYATVNPPGTQPTGFPTAINNGQAGPMDFLRSMFPNTFGAAHAAVSGVENAPNLLQGAGAAIGAIPRIGFGATEDALGPAALAARGLGQLAQGFGTTSGVSAAINQGAHMAAPAPQSVAQQVAADIPGAVKPKPSAAEMLSSNVSGVLQGLQGKTGMPLPVLSALAGLVPLYKTPMDARNQAGNIVIQNSRDIFNAEMAAAGPDAAKQALALRAYNAAVLPAMGGNELADAFAGRFSGGQAAGAN